MKELSLKLIEKEGNPRYEIKDKKIWQNLLWSGYGNGMLVHSILRRQSILSEYFGNQAEDTPIERPLRRTLVQDNHEQPAGTAFYGPILYLRVNRVEIHL